MLIRRVSRSAKSACMAALRLRMERMQPWVYQPSTSRVAGALACGDAGGHPDAASVNEERIRFPAASVTRLPGADLVGRHAVVFVPGRGCLVESVGGRGYVPGNSVTWSDLGHMIRARGHRGTRPTADEWYVPLIHRWAHGYYHWVMEQLPRLQAVEAYTAEVGGRPRFILPRNIPDFARQSMRLLGYADSRLVEWPGRTQRNVNVLFSSVRYALDWQPLATLDWLRTRVVSAASRLYGPPRLERPRFLFVSRARSARRCPVNEAELVRRLEPLGFTCVHPELYEFGEQVLMFRDARVIVAPHGAGLTNMVWAKHVRVFELFGETQVLCYRKLATQLGFPYASHASGVTAEGTVIDVGRVAQWLESELARDDAGAIPEPRPHPEPGAPS